MGSVDMTGGAVDCSSHRKLVIGFIHSLEAFLLVEGLLDIIIIKNEGHELSSFAFDILFLPVSTDLFWIQEKGGPERALSS
jgi:hypothetical protein